jgi:hypothetical protein
MQMNVFEWHSSILEEIGSATPEKGTGRRKSNKATNTRLEVSSWE